MTDRQSTHAPGCWGWGPRHYECAVREIERLRKMHQDAYQRGLQAGSRGLREMYDAIQAVKRQDAWGNARLTEELMAAEERAERAEAATARWLYIRRKLCLIGNGDGTYRMEALNLPARIQGQPEHGKLDDFYDAAVDQALLEERDALAHGGEE